MLKYSFLLFAIFFPLLCLSQQENLLKVNSIPSVLLENANAVIRWDETNVDVKASNKMVYTNKRIVTILNSSGNEKVGAYMGYDKGISIKKIEARIFNASGKEIKKFKKSDFEDVSAVDGGTLYSDSRVKYLSYTPTDYPYTLIFETEVTYNSTGFIPGWRPIQGYAVSTENTSYKISNSSGIEIKTKTTNFEAFGVERLDDLSFRATNLEALTPESYSPDFAQFSPLLKATLTTFEMEGVKGTNTDWNDFGKWMNEALILDTQILPTQAKNDVKVLTADAKNDIEKAKIVYQYVQDKTRYISVQVGIGGWKPMLASDVHNLGYGDCKGLTNYTKALLDEVGVESYYTVIYGGRDIRNIDESFSSIQGNHVILCIPTDTDYLWLECTSQTSPFGYNANFTDDRDALILTPEGREIVHTKIYSAQENLLDTKASVILTADGDLMANISLNSHGAQYGHHEGIQTSTQKVQKLHYKNYWHNINNVDVVSIIFNNDKDAIIFTEKVSLTAKKYASKVGNRLFLSPNFFNVLSNVPARYRDRKLPFEIERGFYDKDEYDISIPSSFKIESLQKETHLENKFGKYSYAVTKNDDNTLKFKRTFILNKGAYAKEDYEDFRNFWLEVVKQDQSRIILIEKS